MADKVAVYAASALIHTGKGQLAGIVITASAGNPLATFYDNTAGSGTKLFEAYVPVNAGLVILFPERYGPIFATGLYLVLAANLTATVWSRQL